MKNIAILGTGSVGQSLAVGFVKYGYKVLLGTGRPGKKIEWHDKSLKNIKMISYSEAVKHADLVVLAVKGLVAEKVITEVSGDISGKIVIDTTNPISELAPTDGVLHFFTTLEESLMERLQKIAPKSHFVKAFNMIGSALMVNPDFGGLKPTIFYCGNDLGAKNTVAKLLEQFGFEPMDMGKATSARAIEPLCILWCIPGFQNGNWTHALKMLNK